MMKNLLLEFQNQNLVCIPVQLVVPVLLITVFTVENKNLLKKGNLYVKIAILPLFQFGQWLQRDFTRMSYNLPAITNRTRAIFS